MARETATGGRLATTGVIPGAYALSVGNPKTLLPDGWEWVQLTDVARLESGHTPSRRHPEYWGGTVPWIGIRDATGNHGQTIYKTEQQTNDLGISNSSARILPADTVCLSRTASVGYVVMMGVPMATSQDFVNWVCGERLNPHFLKYILLLENQSFRMFSMGTTHQTIYFPEVKAFHIAMPCRRIQDDIVEILGALDGQINLNQRMNETLEAMARAIFKDWFVDFGPTRAKMKSLAPYLSHEIWELFPDQLDEEGKPTGWINSTIGQHMTNFDSKRVPVSSSERAKRQGAYPYHGATGVMDYVDSYLFDGTHLLVGEDGSVVTEYGLAFTQYVWGKIWVNNHAHVLQGKGAVSTEQLLLYFQHEPVTPYITGAVQMKLSQGRMNQMPFIFAGESVCRKFSVVITPLYAKIQANVVESATLRATRDLILPKLLSGEVQVTGVEIMLEKVA